MEIRHNKAQSLIEYGLILGIATVALLSMQTYFKRGIQSMVKVVADDYGSQGERVRDIEMAIKKKVYYDEKTQDGKDKLAVNSQNKMDSVQTKTNYGESSIKSSTVNTNTIRGNEPSVMIGADYSNRKVN